MPTYSSDSGANCNLMPNSSPTLVPMASQPSSAGTAQTWRFTSPENAVFLHGNSFAAARDTYLTSLGAIELQGGYLRIVQRGK